MSLYFEKMSIRKLQAFFKMYLFHLSWVGFGIHVFLFLFFEAILGVFRGLSLVSVPSCFLSEPCELHVNFSSNYPIAVGACSMALHEIIFYDYHMPSHLCLGVHYFNFHPHFGIYLVFFNCMLPLSLISMVTAEDESGLRLWDLRMPKLPVIRVSWACTFVLSLILTVSLQT